MVQVLIIGILLTGAILGLAWGVFILLRKLPLFSFLDSRYANKKMLEGSILFYFISIIIIIYFMLHVT